MNRKSFYGLLILLTCLPWRFIAQTVMINGVPRDTSYTVYSSFQKEVKRVPSIRTHRQNYLPKQHPSPKRRCWTAIYLNCLLLNLEWYCLQILHP